MAIKFQTQEEKEKIKASVPKIHKARKIFLILAIIASALLALYCLARLVPAIVVLPLLIAWLFVVLIPSTCTVGVIWFSDGYRKFVNNMNNAVSNAFSAVDKGMQALQKSLPYTGSIMMALVVTYFVLSLISYKKETSEKNNMKHLIISIALLVVAISFLVIDIVYYQNIDNVK